MDTIIIASNNNEDTISLEPYDQVTPLDEANDFLQIKVHLPNNETAIPVCEESMSPQNKFNISLVTKLKVSGMFEYWIACQESGNSKKETCLAKTLSGDATMAQASDFLKLAKSLAKLMNHANTVPILQVSVDELPYSIYYEYMECGTLRDFMMRNYQQSRNSLLCIDMSGGLPASIRNQLQEILTFAYDIANAMSFLTSRKFGHPAMSIKKVLLTENCACQLYDFYPTSLAALKINTLLKQKHPPTAWMAPETVFLNEYSSASDMWSYAVLLWELFTLGETPFAGFSTEQIENKIRLGTVLTQPLCCPGAIYGIMLSSWATSIADRPTFTTMRENMKDLLESFANENPDKLYQTVQKGNPYRVLSSDTSEYI